jgi:hypothetical protein
MSPNIPLEEILGIKNNYKTYFGCTGIDCVTLKFLLKIGFIKIC